MNGAVKVILGLGVLLLVAVLGVVAELLPRMVAWHMVKQAAADPDPFGFQTAAAQHAQAAHDQAVLDARYAAEMAERRRQAMLLRPGEQCIGGTVVMVSGSTYTQAIAGDGRPVRCEGQYRVTAR